MMAMNPAPAQLEIGLHRVEIEPPDTCVVRFVGDLDAVEVSRILDAFEGLAAGRARAYLLLDIRRLGQISPEARRVSGMRQLPPSYAGLVLFGGSFQQQLMAKLATTAGWLLRGRYLGKPKPACVDDERAARAWLSAQRR